MIDPLLVSLREIHGKPPARIKAKPSWFWIVAETDVKEKFVPSIEDIKRSVCRRFPGVTMNDLVSERRTGSVVVPRQIAIFLARSITPKSCPSIGSAFGGRDHTTVLYSIRKIDRLSKTDEPIRRAITDIRVELGCPA